MKILLAAELSIFNFGITTTSISSSYMVEVISRKIPLEKLRSLFEAVYFIGKSMNIKSAWCFCELVFPTNVYFISMVV